MVTTKTEMLASIPPALSETAGAERTGAELRQQPRFALLLRTAKLVSRHGEFLCIIRDVSKGGMRLRLFHALPEDCIEGLLELGNGEQYAVELVWQGGGEAGFRFASPIDLERFMSEPNPYPKRGIRLRMEAPAMVTVGEHQIPVTMRDLSRQGACIESDEPLALRQVLRIEGPHLPAQEATICWRRAPCHGLVFDRVMTMSELAIRAAEMQDALIPE